MDTAATPRSFAFVSTVPYESSRIHAAAIYCSDGRMGAHFDDFLHHGLKLPRYDRVALPGGPGRLSPSMPKRLHERGILDGLTFLVEAHGLTRIVLISHTGCAFYARTLALEAGCVDTVQRADLVRAADCIRMATGLGAIEAYFAGHCGMGVGFERIEL
jgi:hypothetical protein